MGDDSGLIRVKRHSKKKCGIEVERRKDGYYYITSVGDGSSDVSVGDRVLEINGVHHEEFESPEKANGLFETITFDVASDDDGSSNSDHHHSSSKKKKKNKRSK
uniref:PDZ domain-containing protein n=1 Tax=Craspedostauros australis TaxID=1486917 RepID=A0A7R9ZQF9_9STRA|mmetsp:Transcript_5747/g.15566  ORF Transcript_5747/g.15566 Transcript_5747/m.15566 type:complete len:104 (+) Transcript_5747:315-626(+)|eukprot:CAMPEP_0198110944 /NCGR_PEP_ID=MMETSP1442-20131203/2936_1 /TAXON_ID= /ORGANISM="Craspedostauros australis, Strain CCMP3328" /LENGTH=103 /DNA_ID=CAMNT_0043767191 /DNA_START=302 /DNA_END=613 /DNA_ORIENTATION=-